MTTANTPPRRPFLPEDFDEPCEDCPAQAGEYCVPGCPSGYTADDARYDQTAWNNQIAR